MIDITVNNYPIGWEWIENIPEEDYIWFLDVMATMTDNTDTVSEPNGEFEIDSEYPFSIKKVISLNKRNLANFLNKDQGYEGGIREYGYYIAARALHITSEGEYMKRYDILKQICNR